MPRNLSASEVAALSEDGDHYVARNLRLQIRDGGKTRSWVFRYQFNGRVRRMGLGPARLVKFGAAQRKALLAQQLLLDGFDPMVVRDSERQVASVTFAEATEEYIKAHAAGWSSPKHSHQVRAHLETYAYPVIGQLRADQIDANHVVRILQPIWTTKHETATRVRARIEAVLDWAKSAGHRTGDNPAAWKAGLQHRLPPTSRVAKVEHHVAVPYPDAPAVFARLAAIDSTASKSLRFLALTGVRYAEGMKATGEEFDLGAEVPVWVVPAARMKSRKSHRVPLSPAAVAIVRSLDPQAGRLVFHGKKSRIIPVSDTRMRTLLRETCSVPNVTSHGWRSTLRDWCAEQTTFPPMVAEAALAHSLGSKVERAYLRSDLFDQRVKLMTEWSEFLTRA